MRILLIRHGETVDNVTSIYAGVRDSALTTHGVLQTTRLASHLASTGVKISHIYSSDLQRAFKTAEAIRLAQSPAPAETVKLEILREQDFGYFEGKSYFERPKGKSGRDAHRAAHAHEEGYQEVEGKPSMVMRMEQFVSSHLVDHFYERVEGNTVVIVAHGIILSHLWRVILKRFTDVHLCAGVKCDRDLTHLGAWSNTGYLDLEIKLKPLDTIIALQNTQPASSETPSEQITMPANLVEPASPPPTPPSIPLPDSPVYPSEVEHVSAILSLHVRAVNSQAHLKGLKKTRGGIGSSKHDDKQQTIDSFVNKKRRTE